MNIDTSKLRFKTDGFYELTHDDIYEMVKVRYEVFACEQEITCENDFDDKDKVCKHTLVYYEDKLVGYCRILPAGLAYEKPSIGRVLVLKEFRKNYIAQEMIKKSTDFIREYWMENEIILSSQLYAKRLYEAVGFEVISDVYDEAGIPHVKMSLDISKN
ncbi:GNAT family N-acetyltransferase [Clostridium gasigenes]|uniref:GNAT family N-acetyltransferase n=1 Tax=Clostridium gasigenes TaxID=94869 RepID=A0A7X0VRT3_9CLOT|nr:GNAT family N-acetyltransferase [Clostridium gasigenes]MBB6715724.1 GNAT family N-acetyltransferase [Clostridium gasigenes]